MKIVINRNGEGFDVWNDDFLNLLISMGWKCTTLIPHTKGTPKDKDAYIAMNYVGCLIPLSVNDKSIEEALRTHPDFIKIVEEKLVPYYSHLSVINIPDGIDYYIDSCEHGESIHETHRVWC